MRILGTALVAIFTGSLAHGESIDGKQRSAYRFDAVYIADVWRNTRGGLRTGDAYLGNLDLMLSIDGELAWGVPGLNAFMCALHNHGDRLSERFIGDAMTASNIDAPEALRLYEAWLEWRSGGSSSLSVRFGLYDLNSEFDVNDTRGLFIHSTHGVGHDLGQTGLNGPSIFPVTSLGLRVAWQPRDDWMLLAAVFDGVPGDPEDPTRTRIHLSSDEGALVITELQWLGRRVSKLALGHWRYTGRFEDVRAETPGDWSQRRGNAGAYASLEYAFGALEDGAPPAATAFVRYGFADGRFNEFDRFAAVGVRYRGVFRGRDDDELGFAVSHASTSAKMRRAGALNGTPRDRYESALELTYRMPVTDSLVLQPDIQYIVNPGADPQLAHSLVLGLRAELAWGVAR